jgi:hypothetical protein
VTNPTWPAKRLVRFYNQRGTAEQRIKEGKNAVRWTRYPVTTLWTIRCGCNCSCYVLGANFRAAFRDVAKAKSVHHWTLTTLWEKLIKIGVKVARHSKKIVFQIAEVALPRELFRAILERIGRLRLATAPAG